ncbi:MAG TPA: hypothetical protein VFU43_02530 [Streptosporangiaceae bacterium]|nr:hypothetical protein [Streptosporangiaceae bacterium]
MEGFRVLLVVDAEKFSSHRDAELRDVHMEIRRVLAAACASSGLGETWRAIRFVESTGDGLLAALPYEAAPKLIDPFPRCLQEALAASAPRLRGRGLRLRLRVALHLGLVDDEHPDAPGISAAVIDVNRLLNSQPLRDALRESDPAVTFAAFILSADLFAAYVKGGRTGLRESQFTEVQVAVKEYKRLAYLHVPTPSRVETPSPPADDDLVPQPSSTPQGVSISGITISGTGSQNAFGNTIGRDLRQERA